MRADLHLHTNKSDGAKTPQEIVDIAIEKGIEMLSITDHDTIEGSIEADIYARGKDILILSGIELSAYIDETQVHILGYGFNLNNNKLIEALKLQRERRHERNIKIIHKLNDFNVDISYDEVLEYAAGESVGRKHIADLMVQKGLCSSVQEAFNGYLAEGAQAFLTGDRLTPKEAVKLLVENGAIAVLAHPMKIRMDDDEIRLLINSLKEVGLKGIEADYFAQTVSKRREMRALATKYHLIVTGGSDYHSDGSAIKIGEKFYRPNKYVLKLLTKQILNRRT
ncbi:MAG: PHP domain-containing protein [Clostridia bacterium]